MKAELLSSEIYANYKCPNCRLILKVKFIIDNEGLKSIDNKCVCKNCKEIIQLEPSIFFVSKKHKENKQQNKVITTTKNALKQYGYSEIEIDEKIKNALTKLGKSDTISDASVLVKLALVS